MDHVLRHRMQAIPVDHLALLDYAIAQPAKDPFGSQLAIGWKPTPLDNAEANRSLILLGEAMLAHFVFDDAVSTQKAGTESHVSPEEMLLGALRADRSTRGTLPQIQEALSHSVSMLTSLAVDDVDFR